MASRQQVHVGEEVQFDFVLTDWRNRRLTPIGIADYCVATIGSRRVEAEPDLEGHFQFSHAFTNVVPGDTIVVEAGAFRQRGGRDYMKVRDEWMRSDSPFEEPDKRVARDSIRFKVYSVPIEITLPPSPDEFDPDTGVLRIRRRDGSTTSVFIDRPSRPGFTLDGPDDAGRYTVRYVPDGNVLNPSGTTRVEFTIYDTGGRPHRGTVVLDTP